MQNEHIHLVSLSGLLLELLVTGGDGDMFGLQCSLLKQLPLHMSICRSQDRVLFELGKPQDPQKGYHTHPKIVGFRLTGEDAFLGVLNMSAVIFVQREKGIQWQTLAGAACSNPSPRPCHVGDNFELLECIPGSLIVLVLQSICWKLTLRTPVSLMLEGPEVTQETVQKFFALDDAWLDYRKLSFHSSLNVVPCCG